MLQRGSSGTCSLAKDGLIIYNGHLALEAFILLRMKDVNELLVRTPVTLFNGLVSRLCGRIPGNLHTNSSIALERTLTIQ